MKRLFQQLDITTNRTILELKCTNLTGEVIPADPTNRTILELK